MKIRYRTACDNGPVEAVNNEDDPFMSAAGLGNQSGGNPQYSPMLARAAVSAGVNGLFLECHPDPRNAKSDAATMLNLTDVEPLLASCRQIAEIRRNW